MPNPEGYLPYLFTPGSEHYRAAAQQVAWEPDGHGAHFTARPGGPSFDENTGVLHEAYGQSLYSALPWSGDLDIDGYFKAHL